MFGGEKLGVDSRDEVTRGSILEGTICYAIVHMADWGRPSHTVTH